jgi:hypothetical protein
MATVKLGRNDPCWCGSGKKYKRCHFNRQFEKRLPFEALFDKLREATQKKICFHPDASATACRQIISAHTVQRSRVLGKLVGSDNHVLTFNTLDQRAYPPNAPSRVGWRDASTVTGFCARHDSVTFAPLEQFPFVGSLEQCFLLGYRAACHEIFHKQGVVASYETTRNLVDRGLTPELQRRAQAALHLSHLGAQKGLSDLVKYKTQLDHALQTRNFGVCSAVVIEFAGDLSVSCSGTISPNADLSGRQLQILHLETTTIESVSISVDATPAGGVAVFVWFAGHKTPEEFINSLLAMDENQQINTLPQLFFQYLENTYFSESWWESLPDGKREHLQNLALNDNPYYFRQELKDESYTPWRFVKTYRY